MSRRGRRRLVVCWAGKHLMTDANRRWRAYTRRDGTTVLQSDGCRKCNAERTKRSRGGVA